MRLAPDAAVRAVGVASFCLARALVQNISNSKGRVTAGLLATEARTMDVLHELDAFVTWQGGFDYYLVKF